MAPRHGVPGAQPGLKYVMRIVPSAQREQWDRFVTESAPGHLLQSWGWGELKALAGWSPLRLALYDGDQVVAAAQVLRRTAPHMPLRAGHLAYIPRGPVIDWSQPALCTSFFSHLTTCLRGQGAIALRMEPELPADAPEVELVVMRMDAMRMHPTSTVQPLRTIVVDLSPTEEALLAQMKEKWRYNVRLAGRKGVTVRAAQSSADVSSWYRLLQTTGARDQFGIHTADYYLNAWNIFAPRDEARLLLAEYDGQLLSGIFVGLFAHQAIYLYGASSNEQRQLMPNYLLQWEAMRWAKQRGAHSYDLWGIPATDAEDEAMAGVCRFKRGWGGRVVQFIGCYEAIYNPLLMQVASKFM